MPGINITVSTLLVVLFIILFFRKKNSLPNKVLAILLLIPSLNYMNNLVILSNGIFIFPWSYFLVQITGALFAPFAYYYIILMTGRPMPKSFRWLKFVSVLIILSGIIIVMRFIMLDAHSQEEYLTGVINGPYPDDMLLYSNVLFIHQLLYLTSCFLHVRKYRKEMMDQVSDLTATKVSYLYGFVVLLWILTLTTVTAYLTIDTIIVEYIVLPVVLLVIFVFILYYAFSENAVFSTSEYKEFLVKFKAYEENNGVNESISSSENHTSVENNQIFRQINNLIENEDLYKNPGININSLSDHLDIPAYKLSSVIKNNGWTFYELIRKKRVDKAKEMLIDEKCSFSIEAIAYEVGFNSRASFYRAFQKYEDKSPSELLKTRK